MAATTLAVLSFVITVVQSVRARKRQKKLEKEAKARQDAAKGFMVPIEGFPSELGIAYGRNKIGGVRVFHETQSSYGATDPAPGGVEWHNKMKTSSLGSKSEFMIVQQALCIGPINRVVHLLVDERDYDDEFFRKVGADDPEYSQGGKGGLVIHTYTDGGVSDPLVELNAYNRTSAKFNNIAYLTGIFRLNRDDPQFNAVPQIQALVEGMRIHTIVGAPGSYTLSAERVYSNNPAYVLLDYLLNKTYGRGLPLEFIDLHTFKIAADICDTVVKANAPKNGKFWEHTEAPRDIKLYECNLTLSTADSIRRNIETILETMGQAELIWSSGSYKLSLFYPKVYDGSAYETGDVVQYEGAPGEKDLYRSLVDSNTDVPGTGNWARDVVSAYISDDEIDESGDATRNWPNAQERFNFVSVRYIDESYEFEDNVASWPFRLSTVDGPAEIRGEWSAVEKYNQSDVVESGGMQWQLKTGFDYVSATAPSFDENWILYDGSKVYNQFLQEDGGLPLETEFFETGCTDYYHALAKAEQRCRSSRESIIYKFTGLPILNHLEPGDIIRVNSDILNIFGELMRIEETKVLSSGGIDITAVRFDARILAWNADDDEVVNIPAAISTSVAQASGLVFNSNNTDVSFTSGKLQWTAADDGRVNRYEIVYTPGPISAIDENTSWSKLGETIDLAFDVPPLVGATYTFAVIAITYDGRRAPINNSDTGSSWPKIEVGINKVNINDWAVTTVSVYKEASLLPTTPTGGVYDFDQLALSAVPAGWEGSPPTATATTKIWVSHAVVSALGATGDVSSLTWSKPTLYQDTSVTGRLEPAAVGVLADENGVNFGYDSAVGVLRVFAGTIEVTTSTGTTFSVVSVTNCAVTINNTIGSPNKGKYTVTSLTGSTGSAILRAVYNGKQFDYSLSISALNQGYSRDITPPPSPSGVTVTTAFSNIFVQLASLPAYTVGHGHDETIVYGAEGTAPVFADAVEVGRFRGTHFRLPSEMGKAYRLWFKNETVDGIASVNPFGGTNGVDATTGKINGVDLGPLIVEATNLADQAVNGDKLAVGAIAVGSAAIANGAIVNAMIANAAIDTANIANAAITSALIDDAAITSAKILNAAITSAKIANTIQSDNYSATNNTGWQINKSGTMYINQINARGTIYSENAYVRGDVEASSIKAGSANIIDTLMLQGETVVVKGVASSTATLSFNNSWATKLSKSISFPDASGSSGVSLSAYGICGLTGPLDSEAPSYATSQPVHARILRNGVDITGQMTLASCLYKITSGAGGGSGSIEFVDFPGAGTHTYQLQLKTSGASYSGTTSYLLLSVDGAKR